MDLDKGWGKEEDKTLNEGYIEARRLGCRKSGSRQEMHPKFSCELKECPITQNYQSHNTRFTLPTPNHANSCSYPDLLQQVSSTCHGTKPAAAGPTLKKIPGQQNVPCASWFIAQGGELPFWAAT